MPDLDGLPRAVIPRGTPDGGAFVQTPDGKPLATHVPNVDYNDFDGPIAISTAVVQLGSKRLSYDHALISVETEDIRYRVDGGEPTSSVGHLLPAGDTLILIGKEQVRDVKFIRDGASDGAIQVSFGQLSW